MTSWPLLAPTRARKCLVKELKDELYAWLLKKHHCPKQITNYFK